MNFSAEAVIPFGILATDHWHRHRNDGTCSRCRKAIPDDQVPLMLWSKDGHNMLIYCDGCLNAFPIASTQG